MDAGGVAILAAVALIGAAPGLALARAGLMGVVAAALVAVLGLGVYFYMRAQRAVEGWDAIAEGIGVLLAFLLAVGLIVGAGLGWLWRRRVHRRAAP